MSTTTRSRADRSSPRPRTLVAWIAVAAAAVAGLSACGGDDRDDSRGNAGGQAADLGKPEGLLEWMATHPENAGLVLLPGKGPAEIELNGDRRFALASTRKVLIVGALTQSGDSLGAKVPRSKVERFYAPGTDAGAHQEAGLDEPRLTLGKIAQAAIVISDNAAADTLLDRVGADAVDAYAEEQGMGSQDPIYPILGEIAAWTRERMWASLSPAERAQRADELTRSVSANEVKLPGISDQRRLAAKSVAGTPMEWATLMRNIAKEGAPQLLDILDWPRRKDPDVRKAYTRYLTKGGSLPGVVTEASYVQPRGRPGVAVALFLRDLPPDVETTLRETFSQQKLLLRLASDAAFRKQAGRMLAR